MAKDSISSYLHIGENMKRERKAAGYTQREFAQLLGIPVSTYSNYENGNRAPGPDVMEAVARKLNIPFERLITVSKTVAQLLEPQNEYLLSAVAEDLDLSPEYIRNAVNTGANIPLYPVLEAAIAQRANAFFGPSPGRSTRGGYPTEGQRKLIQKMGEALTGCVADEERQELLRLLLEAFPQLNTDGQRKALAYVQDLTKIPEYQKPREEQEKENQKAEQEAPNGEKSAGQPQTVPDTEKDSEEG